MGRKRKYIPRYYGFRIYFISTLLYFFLVMPIVGILFAKYGPELYNIIPSSHNSSEININPDSLALVNNTLTVDSIDQSNTLAITDTLLPQTDSLNIILANGEPITVSAENTSENKIIDTSMVLLKLLLLSFLIGFAYNLPFKLYFKKKKHNKPIPEKLFKYCKKFLTKTPTINSLILLLAYGVSIGYMAYMLMFFEGFDEITSRLYLQYFFISILATILTVVFVYYWQRHRVQLKYLEYIFTEEELKRRVYDVKAGKLKNRMWVTSGMTTLLPLIIVVFYLFLSSTKIKDLGIEELSSDQIHLLFGKYQAYFEGFAPSNFQNFFFVNAFDSLLMFTGIFTGIFTSLIYILIFIRWTTMDIVRPVKELLDNMRLTGQGELDQYSIVRTNDEIGELTEGFNEMSGKIKEYILSISRINQANSRFVPRQFIEFLGKDNIADISLGDQIQKEMTILFSDIREFTSISEDMTPKENFDFLNNYLGYMEPVIRINRGFIDKFMGDSIMSLFSDKPEDAINAAIEMRIKLAEFNQVLRQFGKPPIDSGIGLHTGSLMLGIVGGEGRMDSTVISDSVNLASRLEGLTKLYGSAIIISEDTLIKLNDPSQYNYRFLDIVKVKGKKEAVYIFEILDGEPPEIKELKIKTKTEFGTALQHYKNKEFKKALPLFKEVFKINKFDKASEMYSIRCNNFIENGIPENWDGIEIITEK